MPDNQANIKKIIQASDARKTKIKKPGLTGTYEAPVLQHSAEPKLVGQTAVPVRQTFTTTPPSTPSDVQTKNDRGYGDHTNKLDYSAFVVSSSPAKSKQDTESPAPEPSTILQLT